MYNRISFSFNHNTFGGICFFYFLFTVCCLLPAIVYSQDSNKVKIPADTNAFCIVGMNDGLLLKGKIIERKETEIKFRDNNLGLLFLKLKNISFIQQAGSGLYFIFYMKDGSLLHGKISNQNAAEIEIETKSIGITKIPAERIKEMRHIEEKDMHRRKYWYPNPNSSRYFFGPSAIPLRKQEGYYQNADVLLNSANYGVTKNFSIQAGAIIPFAIFLMPKFGFKVKENLHLGGGMVYASTLIKFRKTNYKVGALYGLATLGNNNNNITFGAGYGFSDMNNTTIFFQKPVLTINGMARVSRTVSLVTENVFFPVKYCYYKAEGKVCEYNYKQSFSFGARIMKERTTVDFGLLSIPNDIISAFVYLDFVIKF